MCKHFAAQGAASFDNDVHMAVPAPEKIFGEFVYEGEISVQVNPVPKL